MVERAAAALYRDGGTLADIVPWPPHPDEADLWRAKARLAINAAMKGMADPVSTGRDEPTFTEHQRAVLEYQQRRAVDMIGG
jgi:hypothetical protein